MATLKNRLVIYSWLFQEVDYFNPYECTTDICVKVLNAGKNTYIYIPRIIRTPAQIECYIKGFEDAYKANNKTIVFERRDYEY